MHIKPTIILVFLIKDIFQISITFSIGIIQTCSSLLHFLTENKLNLWSKFSKNLNPRANVSLFLLRMESKRNMQGQNIKRHLEKATTELHVSPFLHRDSAPLPPCKREFEQSNYRTTCFPFPYVEIHFIATMIPDFC